MQTASPTRCDAGRRQCTCRASKGRLSRPQASPAPAGALGSCAAVTRPVLTGMAPSGRPEIVYPPPGPASSSISSLAGNRPAGPPRAAGESGRCPHGTGAGCPPGPQSVIARASLFEEGNPLREVGLFQGGGDNGCFGHDGNSLAVGSWTFVRAPVRAGKLAEWSQSWPQV